MQDILKNMPYALQRYFAKADFEELTEGLSADSVYRVLADEACILKIGSNLQGEYERLQWLENKLPVPRVLHFEVTTAMQYLLMSELSGAMMHEVDLPYQRRIEVLAEGARMWHSIAIEDCPFDWTIDVQVKAARYNLEQGLVNESDFDIHRQGRSAKDLLSELLVTIPDEEDLVLTHGDYCLPNVLVEPQTGQITGFVDLGRAGVSERWYDLALCIRSITYNLGGIWTESFLDAYAIPMNRAKYNFYTLLDEFF
jgi:kanamycin kinase/aminoglycoside 3'-phosphotransferase-2